MRKFQQQIKPLRVKKYGPWWKKYWPIDVIDCHTESQTFNTIITVRFGESRLLQVVFEGKGQFDTEGIYKKIYNKEFTEVASFSYE